MSGTTPPTSDADPGPSDGTLGGYFSEHDRPPAFEGSDGHPYTVSIEVEQTPNLRAPCHGYLVFPRWAQTGVGITGHVETPTLVEARTTQEALDALGALPLHAVQSELEQAIHRAAELTSEAAPSPDTRPA